MSDRTPGVAVAVISFNTRDILRDCLASVSAESPAELVVVDNGSTDGSVEMVRREFPGVRLVVDPTNPGYGAASNRALAECAAPFVLLLNSDTRIGSGTLGALREYMERHPRVGMAGPRLVNPDGSLQRSCFAQPSTAFLLVEHSPLGGVARWIPGVRKHFFLRWPHREPHVVPWVLGAALMLRRTAFDAVGGFDPSFYMYYEETDLAYRLAAAGWETHFAPVTEVIHLGGASTSSNRAAMRERYFRSMIRFAAVHRSHAETVRLASTLHALVVAKLGLDSVQRFVVRDRARRHELDERIALWRRLARIDFREHALTLRAERAGAMTNDAADASTARARAV